MAQAQQTIEPRNEIVVVRNELDTMRGEFEKALPAHIPIERFARVVMTALQNNPDLMLKCNRKSLWNSCMKAAQDGLLPDGREGAVVPYGENAQWIPMIAGLRKKVRNSGDIATWDAQVVHERDAFEFELGDDPFIKHKPYLGDNPGAVIAAYSIAVLKSGEKSREVMSVAQIEKIRVKSRQANKGPWVDHYEEMCRKTVAKRHSKVLPMSTDLDDLMRRDEDLYDFNAAREEAGKNQPKSLAGRLDALASPDRRTIGNGHATADDVQDAVVTQEEDKPAQQAEPSQQQTPTDRSTTASTSKETTAADRPASGQNESQPEAGSDPRNAKEYITFASGWIERLIDPTAGEVRWKAEKKMRNGLDVPPEDRDQIEAGLKAKCAELRKPKQQEAQA